MPGITVIDAPPDEGAVDDALESVRFFETYDRTDVIAEPDLHVAFTGYPAYPVVTVELDGCVVVLEGYLYDVDDLEASLEHVVSMLREGREDALTEWMLARDGDYLILVVDRSEETIWAINDLFARLPTYRAQIGDTVVLSRELKAIRRFARSVGEPLQSDPIGLGQMLMFGYTLGTRTLFADVSQLPPASLWKVGASNPQILHEYRFDRHPNADRSIEENAQVLKELFIEACRNRARVADATVVSLSGGLDSRSVLAGYTHVDGPVMAATSMRPDGGKRHEIDVAMQVAHALDIPWASYVADRTPRHRAQLLDMTQGMNDLGRSIGLDFVEQVAAEHGSPMFVTGDGLSIPDRQARRTVHSTDELVEAIITDKQVFSLDDVTSIVDVSRSALVRSVREQVASYPEETLDGKHLHHYFRERSINWLNHGEDRTRYHLWSTTPAYAPEFFAESMACPPEQKRGTRLSRAFLTELAPAVVEIDYADYGAPISSPAYRMKRFTYEWLIDHPRLRRRIFPLFKGNGSDGEGIPPTELVYARENAGESLPLSMSDIQRVTWANGGYSSDQRHLLLTVVGAVTYDSERPAVQPQEVGV